MLSPLIQPVSPSPLTLSYNHKGDSHLCITPRPQTGLRTFNAESGGKAGVRFLQGSSPCSPCPVCGGEEGGSQESTAGPTHQGGSGCRRGNPSTLPSPFLPGSLGSALGSVPTLVHTLGGALWTGGSWWKQLG